MAYCTNCGRLLMEDFDFCPECGTEVLTAAQNAFAAQARESTQICPRCGERMPSDAFYCLSCGAIFDEQAADFSNVQNSVNYQSGIWRNKWITLLLCVFFGWMGAHKYYEGKVRMGVIYTLTLGLFFIGWVVDIIVLAWKPNPYMVWH